MTGRRAGRAQAHCPLQAPLSRGLRPTGRPCKSHHLPRPAVLSVGCAHPQECSRPTLHRLHCVGPAPRSRLGLGSKFCFRRSQCLHEGNSCRAKSAPQLPPGCLDCVPSKGLTTLWSGEACPLIAGSRKGVTCARPPSWGLQCPHAFTRPGRPAVRRTAASRLGRRKGGAAARTMTCHRVPNTGFVHVKTEPRWAGERGAGLVHSGYRTQGRGHLGEAPSRVELVSDLRS